MNVADVLSTLASWPTLLLAILTYGFAPGFLLRLIVLAYEPDDPRRHELVAELYIVPRLQRPFWVAEQLETALFEGLWERVLWAATGRIIHRWKIGSAVKQNKKYPDTFWIPAPEERAAVEPGIKVKLMFRQADGWAFRLTADACSWGERMWVEVDEVKGRRRLIGRLLNRPVGGFPRLDYGSKIQFTRDQIIDINWPELDEAGTPHGDANTYPELSGEVQQQDDHDGADQDSTGV